MNIILLGQQGSGKGTQARILLEKFGFHYFESGAYLRRIAEDNEEVKKLLAQGEFVPDAEMTSYLTAYLDKENLYDDIIFDGFPRNLPQYEFLKNWLDSRGVKIDLVIVLTISDAETIRRLAARRFDPVTGKTYNLVTNPPPPEIEVSRLVQREDDKPEAIRRRLELYRRATEPLIARLKEETKVIEVDGERPIEVIASEIAGIIEQIQAQEK